MNAAVNFRRVLLKFLTFRPISLLLRLSSPLLRAITPRRLLSRIPMAGEIVVAYAGWQPVRMHNNGSDSIATRIYWGGGNAFDPESIDLFLRLAHDSRVIFDIGANTGIYSLLSARNNPSAIVYAFEPVPSIRGEFERSVAVNGLTNLKVSGLAISDSIGRSEFHIPNDFAAFPTSASLNRDFRSDSSAISVSVTTVDEFVRQNGVGHIDLMKIDTESTEHLVLAGASRTLTNDRPFIICEVLPEQNPKLLCELLTPNNYSYFRIAPDGLFQKRIPEGDPRCENLNYLFVPTEQISKLVSLSHNVILLGK